VTIYFIDSSVLLEILDVPGKASEHPRYLAEFARRAEAKDRFILPVATLVETGNHIAQAASNRHESATRLERLIRSALDGKVPWAVRTASWDDDFVADLLTGGATGQSFVEHCASGLLGAGDLSILVEREYFVRETAYRDVQIWTKDARLLAYS